MTSIATGAALVVTSIILPFVVALCQSEGWSARTKEWVAVAVATLVGVAYVVQSGAPLADVPAVAAALVGGMQVAYLAFSAIGVKSKVLDALARVRLTVEPKADDGSTSTDTTESSATAAADATASGQVA